MAIVMRLAQPSDNNFIMNSYLRSYRNSPENEDILNDFYFAGQTRILDKIRKTSNIIIACDEDTPDLIYGYAIADKGPIPTIHYVYVRYSARKLGIAKRMLKSCFPEFGDKLVTVTHKPRQFDNLRTKFKLIYDPFTIRG